MANDKKAAWQNFAQTFELGWWSLKDFKPEKSQVAPEIWKRFGFERDQFKGKVVYDVGCGPTGLTWWFDGALRVGVDPLADRYRKLPWFDATIYQALVSAPIEEPAESMVGGADFVFCVNCLDHCYDLDLAIAGLMAYAKPGAGGFVSVDVDKPCAHDITHPICVHHRVIEKALIRAGWRIERAEHGCCYPAEPRWLDAWGGGMAYHYWVKKPE